MSSQLGTIAIRKTGWKKLDEILVLLAQAINRVTPRAGAHVSVDQTESGSIIRAFFDKNDTKDGVQNQNGNNSNPPYVNIHNAKWQQVTLVDPTTCAQTQAWILAQDPNGGTIKLPVKLNADTSWTLQVQLS